MPTFVDTSSGKECFDAIASAFPEMNDSQRSIIENAMQTAYLRGQIAQLDKSSEIAVAAIEKAFERVAS